jgi:N-acetylglutamate synthase-like GNAT family acetyltransferase
MDRTETDQPASESKIRIEPATLEDLPHLTELVMALFEQGGDFKPNRGNQENGLKLILEQPNRGRIFVLRNDHHIIGMVNLIFTISTAVGGFAINMEDVIIHPEHRGQGYGTRLIKHVIRFAKKKDFKRITLLTDKISAESQSFFKKNGFNFSQMIPMRRVIDPGVEDSERASESESGLASSEGGAALTPV